MTLLERITGRRRPPTAPTAPQVNAQPAPAPAPAPVVNPAHRDAKVAGWRNQSTQELAPGFGAFPGAVILDIGCGDAPHAAFFAGMDTEIIVADILPDSVKAAGRAVAQAGAAKVQELVTDTDPLPLADSSVDRIVATEVLEHVPDPVQFLGELVRVGRPGARYLLSVPDSRSEQLQAPFAAPDYFTPPNHVRVFSDDDFDELVRDSGLVIEHKQYDGFYQSLWWSFFWISAQPQPAAPWRPLLEQWMRTWNEMLDLERGPELKKALDDLIPKSQVIVAAKAN